MEEKNCKECKNFIQHYKILDNRLMTTLCGNCIKRYGNHRIRTTDKICEFWQQREAPDKNELLKNLWNMVRQLENAILVLIKDNYL